ncbi:helix-turn-helix domain-containing protein [Paenibacillus sacheonensis]|uniref:Helix-turn-helix domain-containing protein n=1 Tax=Paenibacillus sacheonensis TaxID=742054 RepID=A0A7X5BZU1_9BACL|nr:helix-turn-helix domain-containing protein [Paenibacillus sacheonensis]MBM7567198.1 AraC-like DNA-binding protein/mannose-6-phosphate isomerase-like protein (cupin superfamily) [Paenibacillus sacheonensis]NBC70876.1 helix-turn-helix domain-containing protein [Paenibacillus sacheonensis]
MTLPNARSSGNARRAGSTPITGSADAPPYRDQAPHLPLLVENELEYRAELPFDAQSSNLYYIGEQLMPNWATTSHYHDHFELCYLDEGHGQYQIDKTRYPIQAGDLWLTKPGETHYGLAGKDGPFRLIYMGFKLEWMKALQPDFYQLGAGRVVRDEDGAVQTIFRQLLTEVRLRRRLSFQMAEGLFLQLLVTVSRLFHDGAAQRTDALPNPLGSAVIAVMNRLHGEIRYDHDIETIARSIPISRSHLAREFKSAIGMPVGEYMRSLCLDKAKFELRASDKPVTQIAEELYFSSIHTFSIFFKRFTGFTPSDYRRQASRDARA